ncbi:MAG: hypothetical protein FWD95_11620 [Nocardioidaceae bacterium]|nr:hypothetical protein [Nocardioidaceae bacterium]
MSRVVRSSWPEVVVETRGVHLSHDLPCRHCGHAPHRFLPCDRGCGCEGDQG